MSSRGGGGGLTVRSWPPLVSGPVPLLQQHGALLSSNRQKKRPWGGGGSGEGGAPHIFYSSTPLPVGCSWRARGTARHGRLIKGLGMAPDKAPGPYTIGLLASIRVWLNLFPMTI